MEIVAACEDIRARKSHERQVGSVSTASYRLDDRGYPFHLHGFDGLFYNMVMRLHLFLHVVVLVLYLHGSGAFSLLAVDKVRAFPESLFPLLIQTHVMVPYYIGKFCLLYGSAEADYMEESLIAVREFRSLFYREK